MKKHIILGLCTVVVLAALVARAQYLSVIQTNYFQQNTVITVPRTSLVSTNGPAVFSDQANCLAIGQQLGNMTNAAGQKLFLAQYFTNQNFSLTFNIQDAGSVVPFQISIVVGQ